MYPAKALKGALIPECTMATIVLALGGSLLRPEVEERHAWLEELVSIIRDRVLVDDRIGIVVGGGAAAREGINLARPIIDNEDRLDRIGIAATRLNAPMIRESLADAGVMVSGTITDESGRTLSGQCAMLISGKVRSCRSSTIH